MKSKESAKSKKQSVAVKDLKTRKNPKGGVVLQATSYGTIPAGSSPCHITDEGTSHDKPKGSCLGHVLNLPS